MRIDLKKVEQEAPELVSAYKQTKISLSKHTHLRDHVARVALVLDISSSMRPLFDNGLVDRLVAKALPVGLTFDDDGEIDVFAFGINSHEMPGCTMANYRFAASNIIEKHGFEGGTYYARALEMLEAKYADSVDPVFVIFVTDGETSEPDRVTKMIKKLAKLPVFLQFVGLGSNILPKGFSMAEPVAKEEKKGFFASLFGTSKKPTGASRDFISSGFKYLQSIDEMGDRKVDNCNFFALVNPAAVDDEKFYELLMNEYPSWVKDAKAKGILR